MTISFTDLIRSQTVQECTDSIYQALDDLGITTTGWKSGSWVRTILAIVARLHSASTVLMASLARAGFRELSSGDWLTIVAREVYGVERTAATFAAGQITLTNAGGGVYALDPGDLIVLNSNTNKTYTNTESFALGSLEANKLVAIRAIESGTASDAAIGQIDTLVTTLISVSCTNELAVVGSDTESDESLKARCEAKLDAMSPAGPARAYEYVARTTTRADGTPISVTRVRVTSSSNTGVVQLWVAGRTAGITGTAGDPSTDLGAINYAVQTKVAPLGVTALVMSASPVIVPVTYQVWVYQDAPWTATQIRATILTALTDWFEARPVGGDVIPPAAGKLYVDALRAVVQSAIPFAFHAVITTPVMDLTLNQNEVPVLGTVTGAVTSVVR